MQIPLQIHALVPHYHGIGGHEIIYHQTLEKIANHSGFHYKIYATKTKVPDQWIRYFSNSSSLFYRSWEFAKIFRKNKGVFFIESFTAKEMIAYIIAALIFAKKQSCHWLLFRDDLLHQGKKAKISLFFLKLFRINLKKRFTLFSDSKMVAHYFCQKKLPTAMLPNCHAIELEQELMEKHHLHKDAPIIYWWPGPPRKDKGLPEISFLLSSQECPSITLMLSQAFPKVPTKLSVQRLPIELSRSEYLECLNKSQVILLPYDPIAYRCRTSGILVEAVLAGKIPLVKQGSWLAQELNRFHLNELIVNWKDPHFFENVEKKISNINIHHKLELMKQAYRKDHSISELSKALLSAACPIIFKK